MLVMGSSVRTQICAISAIYLASNFGNDSPLGFEKINLAESLCTCFTENRFASASHSREFAEILISIPSASISNIDMKRENSGVILVIKN